MKDSEDNSQIAPFNRNLRMRKKRAQMNLVFSMRVSNRKLMLCDRAKVRLRLAVEIKVLAFEQMFRFSSLKNNLKRKIFFACLK